MSLPDGGTLSTVPTPGNYLAPDAAVASSLLDWERGGVALNDPSQGLDVRNWYARMDDLQVIVGYSAGSEVAQITLPGAALCISLAFDRNMRPNLSYETAAGSVLWWYDPIASAPAFMSLPGARSPRLTHDDKRPIADAAADIICSYLVGDELCYRMQRDRYDTEYVLYGGLPASVRLRNIGMNDGNRLQWVIG